MADIAELKINTTLEGGQEAVEHMERLADAAERVVAALEHLNGQPHGGISFVCIGSFSKLSIEPSG